MFPETAQSRCSHKPVLRVLFAGDLAFETALFSAAVLFQPGHSDITGLTTHSAEFRAGKIRKYMLIRYILLL